MAYKIMWYTTRALHDTSNGASICSKLMLEKLAQRGISVAVLNTFTSEYALGLKLPEHIDQTADDSKILHFNDNGVEYFIVRTVSPNYLDITLGESCLVHDIGVTILDSYQPDMVMGYGQEWLACDLRREAKMRGIPTAYALHDRADDLFSFIDCDLMYTPSEACARKYHESNGIDVTAVGQFIDKQRILATNRAQFENVKYVTFVNPIPVKGLAIFVKLHEVFSRKHPEIPFLVINGRGDYAQDLTLLHNKDDSPYEPNVAPDAVEVEIAEHREDPRFIYDISRVIVMPSVWFEVWGCVATEAVMNGIPVLASKSGGLPEAVGEGGILLDAPACTQKDHLCVPDDDEIAPWVEALERCLDEDWTDDCSKAAEHLDVESSTDRLIKSLEPWLEQGQQHKHKLEHSTFTPA